MSEELKPCPFCGADAVFIKYDTGDCRWTESDYMVRCTSKDMHTLDHIGSKKELREIWNRRQEAKPLGRCACGGELSIAHHPANDGLPYDTIKCQICGKEYDPEEFQEQEVKPLTVELDTYPMVACMVSAFAHLEHQPETVELYQAAHDILAYVRANLPPDQSARIAELEERNKFLESRIKHATYVDAMAEKTSRGQFGQLQSQRDRLIWEIKSVLDMHKRRVAGFPLDHEIEMVIEEHAENLIREIEGGQ